MLRFRSTDGTPSRTSAAGVNRLGAGRRDFQIRGDTWLDAGQISEAPAIQWQFPHRALIHQSGDRSIGCLDQRRLACDGDFVRDRADLKSEVHHGLSADGQGDPAPHDCLETSRLCRDLVASQCQLGSSVAPPLIGAHCPADSLLYTFQIHDRPG